MDLCQTDEDGQDSAAKEGAMGERVETGSIDRQEGHGSCPIRGEAEAEGGDESTMGHLPSGRSGPGRDGPVRHPIAAQS
jgi:hypothetical protein